MNSVGNVPSDWGKDPVAGYLIAAEQNSLATFANYRSEYNTLVAIDRLYRRVIENLNQSPEFVSGFFLFRAHSSYLAAVRLCLSGQIVETYMVLRGCLESSLYGNYVAGNSCRQEVWLRRHENETSLRAMRTEFTIAKLMDHLRLADPKTQDVTKELYDRTIDYGGHPNQRAINTQVSMDWQASRIRFTAEYFLCGNLPQEFCIRSVSQVGICCLDIFFQVFRDRYRLLGIDEELDGIRQGF